AAGRTAPALPGAVGGGPTEYTRCARIARRCLVGSPRDCRTEDQHALGVVSRRGGRDQSSRTDAVVARTPAGGGNRRGTCRPVAFCRAPAALRELVRH